MLLHNYGNDYYNRRLSLNTEMKNGKSVALSDFLHRDKKEIVVLAEYENVKL